MISPHHMEQLNFSDAEHSIQSQPSMSDNFRSINVNSRPQQPSLADTSTTVWIE